MARTTILLPSTLLRAMRAVEDVLSASDAHEYLGAEEAAQLRGATTLLQGTLETALQVCEDPSHERQVIRNAKARIRAHQRWVREVRAKQRAEERTRGRAKVRSAFGRPPSQPDDTTGA